MRQFNPSARTFRDYSFWAEQLYLDELMALLVHLAAQYGCDFLAHSWGAILGATHAARQPLRLKRLVLRALGVARSLQSIPRSFDTEDTQGYEQAPGAFYARHVIKLDLLPEDVANSFESAKQDPTGILAHLVPRNSTSSGSRSPRR
ncbi:hypothetical protein V1524DRAFT_413736 [Lipomyces starkeyi]